MPSSNILLFDANKANMMADEQYNTNTQRLNGVQSGIASSQLQNKTLYQVSLVAYAIAQIMNQNGLDANDTAAVSAFVANLSGTMLQKVADLASTQEAQAGVATGKWMSPALVKAAINYMKATTSEAQVGTNDTKWMSPALVRAAMNTYTANKWLPLSGGTMKGNLILNTSSPTNALQAASKGYVDESFSKCIEIMADGTQTYNGEVQLSGLENAKFVAGMLWSTDIYSAYIPLKNNTKLFIFRVSHSGGFSVLFRCIFNSKCSSVSWDTNTNGFNTQIGSNCLPTNTIKCVNDLGKPSQFNLLLFKLK